MSRIIHINNNNIKTALCKKIKIYVQTPIDKDHVKTFYYVQRKLILSLLKQIEILINCSQKLCIEVTEFVKHLLFVNSVQTMCLLSEFYATLGNCLAVS